MSPNITANRKGKVMMVYGAGDKEGGGSERVREASHERRGGVTIHRTSQQKSNG